MIIGIPTELKNNEMRVAATPIGVRELVGRGHEVLVQSGAGIGSGNSDDDFARAGGRIVRDAEDVWESAELVLKVKEPIQPEYRMLRRGQILFTYLHLAASWECTSAILESGVTAIAYETVRSADGSLPLLQPMSEIAGRLAPQVGAHHLMQAHGGLGVLMGGVAGTPKANVVIIGGGVAGEHAAANALGLEARVTVLDISPQRLRDLSRRFGGALETRVSSVYELEEQVARADLVIGAVLVPGAQAPKLVTRDAVAAMRPGSVLVDIAIDQGGCFEGSRPTTHDDPVFGVHGSLYYCVANMPGAVPKTATLALTSATLRYATAIADSGWRKAVCADPALAGGLNAHEGMLANREVAAAFNLPFRSLDELVIGDEESEPE